MRVLLAVAAISGAFAAHSATGSSGTASSDVVEVIALSAGKEGAPCLGRYKEYSCTARDSCGSGFLVDGLCTDGADVACCVPLSDAKCRAVHGKCSIASSCSAGTALDGRCPGFGDTTCCVQDRRFQVTKVSTPLRAKYGVVASHSGEVVFHADGVAGNGGFKEFVLFAGQGNDVSARAHARWSYSKVWEKQLPTFEVSLNATASRPAATWLVALTPNGRISLHRLEGDVDARRSAEVGRTASEASVQGSWGIDATLKQNGHPVGEIHVEASGRWDVAALDSTGQGRPTLDPRLVLLTSMVADQHQAV